MIFSDFELAVQRGREMVEQEECDLFLCHVKYPSGEEFVLRKSIFIGAGSCVDCFRLPFRHHFKTEANAKQAAKVFESRKGREIRVSRKTVYDSVYRVNKTSHYKLSYV